MTKTRPSSGTKETEKSWLAMTPQDEAVYKNMLAVDGDIFVRYFDETEVVNLDMTSAVRDAAQEIFGRFSDNVGDDFDAFMLRIHDALSDACSRADASSRRNASTQTPTDACARTPSSTRPVAEVTRTGPSTDARTKVVVAENRFEAFDFLTSKKQRRDYHLLEFQPSDCVQSELDSIRFSRQMNATAEEDLRRIADFVSTLNNTRDYPILNVVTG